MLSIIATRDISTKEDYPMNNESIIDEWINGGVNNLKVGDTVILKYLMNTDGKVNPLRFKNQKAIVVGFGNYSDYFNPIKFKKAKTIHVNFENKELNTNDLWIPYNFIKINNL